MSTPDSLLIHIDGHEYRIACPQDRRNSLLQAAATVDERMREVRQSGGRIMTGERVAVMAALHLAHDLQRGEQGLRHTHEFTEQRLGHLLQRLHDALNKTGQEVL